MYRRPFVIYKRAELARKWGEVKFSPLQKEERGGVRLKKVMYLKEAKT